MAFKPGTPKPPTSGRRKGVPNQSTRAVREALVEAFERAGGVDFLVGLAETDPATFARLLARLIPNEIAARVEGAEVIHRVHIGPPPSAGCVRSSPVEIGDPNLG